MTSQLAGAVRARGSAGSRSEAPVAAPTSCDASKLTPSKTATFGLQLGNRSTQNQRYQVTGLRVRSSIYRALSIEYLVEATA